MKKIILLLVLLQSACFSGGPAPVNHYYRLPEPAIDIASTGITSIKSIAVTPFSSDATHRDRAILYSHADKPLQLKQYYYRFWTYSPNQLLQEHLISSIRKTQPDIVVFRGSGHNDIDAYISGHIIHFERVIGSGNPVALVKIEMNLRDRRQSRATSFQKIYEFKVEAKGQSMSATVEAFAKAVDSIFTLFLIDSAQRLSVTVR